jgi:hypothetical protein
VPHTSVPSAASPAFNVARNLLIRMFPSPRIRPLSSM